ncbi:MAG: metallopeptidase family protein [Gemmatimonadales bacterium]
MRQADFEAMVRRMAAEVPEEFLDGVAEISVSPKASAHPDRPDIYTLGECIPLPATDDAPGSVQSRVVLYYGSFKAVARDHPEFDWREEAWETLTHEIRHHVEWRARAPDLEALDEAVEQNYARHDGDAFDPEFYRAGERLADGLFRVEDDYFVELPRVRGTGSVAFRWAGDRYRLLLPEEVRGPAFITVTGVAEPPAGELVAVLPVRGGWRALLDRRAAMTLDLVAERWPE